MTDVIYPTDVTFWVILSLDRHVASPFIAVSTFNPSEMFDVQGFQVIRKNSLFLFNCGQHPPHSPIKAPLLSVLSVNKTMMSIFNHLMKKKNLFVTL